MASVFCRQVKFMLAKIFVWLIKVYQYCISPLLPPSCKFQVSCSRYTQIVIIKYGIIVGLRLAVTRLLRCKTIWTSRR